MSNFCSQLSETAPQLFIFSIKKKSYVRTTNFAISREVKIDPETQSLRVHHAPGPGTNHLNSAFALQKRHILLCAMELSTFVHSRKTMWTNQSNFYFHALDDSIENITPFDAKKYLKLNRQTKKNGSMCMYFHTLAHTLQSLWCKMCKAKNEILILFLLMITACKCMGY